MKKTVSLLMLWSMLMMTYSGIMLFVAPEGRIAYWSNWHMFGLDKESYGDLHVTFMVLFIVTTVFHLFYNVKPILSYLKNQYKRFVFFTKENLWALGITILFTVGTLTTFAPFSTLLEFEKDIKHYWADELGRPPYGHAERSSLKQFSKRMGYDLNEVLKVFDQNSIVVKNRNTNLQTIAKENGTTPAKLYDLLFEALEM